MVGAPDLFTGRSFASAFGALASSAARPNFELQFNILQNSIIGRINKDIEQINESSTENQVDAFLLLSRTKLTIFTENLERFTFANARNAWTIPDLKTKLDQLTTAVNASDTATFDSVLAQVNNIVGNMQPPDGSAIAITIPDGINAIRRDGILNVDRAGVTTKITAYSQFTNSAEALAAITSAQSRLDASYTSVIIKAEAAETVRVTTEKNLTSTMLAIESAQTAGEAEKATELAKVRENYSQLLNMLSLAFESSQAMADRLGKNLFDPNTVAPGSVMNMFT